MILIKKKQELSKRLFAVKIQIMKRWGNAIFIQKLDLWTCRENKKEENGWLQMDLQDQISHS